eukprot:g11592.t1
MRLRSSLFACCGLLGILFGMAVFLRGFFPTPLKSFGSAKAKVSEIPGEPVLGNPGLQSGPGRKDRHNVTSLSLHPVPYNAVTSLSLRPVPYNAVTSL